MFEEQGASMALTDLSGKTIIEKDLGSLRSGLHYLEVDASSAAKGMYIFSLRTENTVIYRRMLKAQ
jgi:hypothetical protein